MKRVLSLAAMLAVALGASLAVSSQAEAHCWKRCRYWVAPVVVPVRPVVPVAPVVAGAAVVAVPAPHPIPRRAYRCRRCYASYVYPSYTVPALAYAPVYAGVGYGYATGACWYDYYGRRFCR